MLITKHADATLRLWDLSSGRPEPRTLPPETRAPNQNDSMRWHLVVDADGTGQLREIATGTVKGRLPLGTDLHRAIVSDAGDQVATLAKDQSVVVRQVSTGKLTPIIHRLESPIAQLQFSPDGKRLLVRDAKGTVRIWDVETAKAITPPMRDPDEMASIHFDADGQRLVFVEKSGEVRVWEMPGTSNRPSNQWDIQPEQRPLDVLIDLLKVHSNTSVNDRQEIVTIPTAHTKAITDKMGVGKSNSKN
jgi:WD40 repeat protein